MPLLAKDASNLAGASADGGVAAPFGLALLQAMQAAPSPGDLAPGVPPATNPVPDISAPSLPIPGDATVMPLLLMAGGDDDGVDETALPRGAGGAGPAVARLRKAAAGPKPGNGIAGIFDDPASPTTGATGPTPMDTAAMVDPPAPAIPGMPPPPSQPSDGNGDKAGAPRDEPAAPAPCGGATSHSAAPADAPPTPQGVLRDSAAPQPEPAPPAPQPTPALAVTTEPATTTGIPSHPAPSGAPAPAAAPIAATEGRPELIYQPPSHPGAPERLTLKLTPAELGSVTFEIRAASQGPREVHVLVDRPETLALFEQDHQHLASALSRAGLDAEATQVTLRLAHGHPAPDAPPAAPQAAAPAPSFGQGQFPPGGSGGGGERPAPHARLPQTGGEALTGPPATAAPLPRLRLAHAVLDIVA